MKSKIEKILNEEIKAERFNLEPAEIVIHGIPSAASRIAEMVKAENGWCRVKVGLPIKDGKYLVTLSTAGFSAVDLALFNNNQWLGLNGNFIDKNAWDVVAWMEMPPPFKEAE